MSQLPDIFQLLVSNYSKKAISRRERALRKAHEYKVKYLDTSVEVERLEQVLEEEVNSIRAKTISFRSFNNDELLAIIPYATKFDQDFSQRKGIFDLDKVEYKLV